MNTYEITKKAASLVAALEDHGGEITDESIAELEAVIGLSKDKLGSILAVRDRLKLEASHHKELAERHTLKRRSLERADKRLNGLALSLLQSLEETEGEAKAAGNWGSVWVTTRATLEIPDESAIPDGFFKEKITRSIDRALIKKALQTAAVNGAALINKQSVTWRTK